MIRYHCDRCGILLEQICSDDGTTVVGPTPVVSVEEKRQNPHTDEKDTVTWLTRIEITLSLSHGKGEKVARLCQGCLVILIGLARDEWARLELVK